MTNYYKEWMKWMDGRKSTYNFTIVHLLLLHYIHKPYALHEKESNGEKGKSVISA